MLNDNAKAWVAALRSGEYKQGRRQLRSKSDRYCCLGVACELAFAAGVVKERQLGEFSYSYDGRHGMLPASVIDWLGLSDEEGSFVTVLGEDTALSMENDFGVLSFPAIANLIESEPEGLFKK